jgi:hypothetical protein
LELVQYKKGIPTEAQITELKYFPNDVTLEGSTLFVAFPENVSCYDLHVEDDTVFLERAQTVVTAPFSICAIAASAEQIVASGQQQLLFMSRNNGKTTIYPETPEDRPRDGKLSTAGIGYATSLAHVEDSLLYFDNKTKSLRMVTDIKAVAGLFDWLWHMSQAFEYGDGTDLLPEKSTLTNCQHVSYQGDQLVKAWLHSGDKSGLPSSQTRTAITILRDNFEELTQQLTAFARECNLDDTELLKCGRGMALPHSSWSSFFP